MTPSCSPMAPRRTTPPTSWSPRTHSLTCCGCARRRSGQPEAKVLKLRRGIVSATDPLKVAVGGEQRPAWADRALVGEICEGDEVVVNVEAKDLALGSGGFDVVHVNLTRGLAGPDAESARAMKLNYSSLQHSVDPVEALPEDGLGGAIPVMVLSLHSQLAPAAWGAAHAGELRVGYVQTGGGALPGPPPRGVAGLRRPRPPCGPPTAGAARAGG